MNSLTCLECKEVFDNKTKLSSHIHFTHKMNITQYCTKHLYNNIKPICKECGEETNFVAGQNIFREYCPKHSNLARSLWSKENGYGKKVDAGWKKGLTKETHPGIKSQSEKISGEYNPWFGKSLPKETVRLATISRIEKLTLTKDKYELHISELKSFNVITRYEDYTNNYKQLLDVTCKACCEPQQKTLWMMKNGTVCRKCTPYSNEEREVGDFIKSLGETIEMNTRKIIGPSELDIYIPAKKLAIEYNGLYWHSEKYKIKKHHINKTLSCNTLDIKLFHVFSDEWNFKKDIIKSMIKNKLGIIDNKIFARKCIIKEIKHKEAEEFFEMNHLSGNTNSKVYFGLFLEEELVSCLSLRIPRNKVYNNKIEIARFASKLNTVVVGGFSKLLKYAVKWIEPKFGQESEYTAILSYADLSHGTGSVYLTNGFKFIKNTELDYWYTDGTLRYDRFKYRAKNGLSESKVATDAQVYKIYGCGSALYEMIL